MVKKKGLRIVSKVERKEKKDPSNLGKKDFVMDKKSFLNWYSW